MASYYKPLTDLLKRYGWEFYRQARGSHEVWRNPATGAKVTVPFDCQNRHTANGILKSAGIDAKL